MSTLDLAHFDTSQVVSMVSMFDGEYSSYSFPLEDHLDPSHYLHNLNPSFVMPPTQILLTNWNTSNVINMYQMFAGCGVSSINLTSFDTSSVINMAGMFRACRDLISLDLANFDTSNVESMEGMFSDTIRLASLNVSSFDTGNVNWMTSMFRMTNSLTNLDLSSFNTSSVWEMSSMFFDTNLESINILNFDTSNVSSIVTTCFQG